MAWGPGARGTHGRVSRSGGGAGWCSTSTKSVGCRRSNGGRAATAPYGVLFAFQAAILVAMTWIIGGAVTGSQRVRPGAIVAVKMFGLIYLVFMGLRLVAGASFADGHSWLDNPLPSVFHLVLASFVLASVAVETTKQVTASSWSAAPRFAVYATYPIVTTGACVGFYVMAKQGVPEPIAAYVPVLVALMIIVASEWKWPYRRSWRPNASTVASDAAFTLGVQVALPTMLALAYALIASSLVEGSAWQLRDLWPHSLPATAQVVLMVFVADLFRYPLHRVMHTSPRLWEAARRAPLAATTLLAERWSLPSTREVDSRPARCLAFCDCWRRPLGALRIFCVLRRERLLSALELRRETWRSQLGDQRTRSYTDGTTRPMSRNRRRTSATTPSCST